MSDKLLPEYLTGIFVANKLLSEKSDRVLTRGNAITLHLFGCGTGKGTQPVSRIVAPGGCSWLTLFDNAFQRVVWLFKPLPVCVQGTRATLECRSIVGV